MVVHPDSSSSAGTRIPREFIVEVRYREPSYETHHGARAEPYRFRYRIRAASEQAAIAFAVVEFERMSVLSSVGWTRALVEIVVEPSGKPPAAVDDNGT